METANTDRATERAEFIRTHGLALVAEFIPQSKSRYAITARADKGPGKGGYGGKGEPCINWRVTLTGRNGAVIYATDYTQGAGHLPGKIRHAGNRKSLFNYAAEVEACEAGRALPYGMTGGAVALAPPTLEDVLYSLVVDSGADDQTFEEWCSNFGYDADSRKAETTYRQCADIGRALRLALGAGALGRLRELYQDY